MAANEEYNRINNRSWLDKDRLIKLSGELAVGVCLPADTCPLTSPARRIIVLIVAESSHPFVSPTPLCFLAVNHDFIYIYILSYSPFFLSSRAVTTQARLCRHIKTSLFLIPTLKMNNVGVSHVGISPWVMFSLRPSHAVWSYLTPSHIQILNRSPGSCKYEKPNKSTPRWTDATLVFRKADFKLGRSGGSGQV